MKEKKQGRSKPGLSSAASNSPATGNSVVALSGKDVSSEVKLKEMLTELRTLINQAQTEHTNSENNIAHISKLHDKAALEMRSRQSPGASAGVKSKLKSVYSAALSDAEAEYDAMKKALDRIQEIRVFREKGGANPKRILRRGVLMSMLQQNALSLPLWIGKPGQEPPPLCGAVQADNQHIAPPGDKVAARVKSLDAEENWILAEAVSFNSATNKYDVDDIDAEEGKERHTLSKRRITPLPLWKAHPEINPEALFPKGALVLALYPQTTCFYRALIHTQPTKPTEDYSVLFEDTSYPNGYSPPLNVCQRYVIVCKDDKKK